MFEGLPRLRERVTEEASWLQETLRSFLTFKMWRQEAAQLKAFRIVAKSSLQQGQIADFRESMGNALGMAMPLMGISVLFMSLAWGDSH